MTIEATTIQVSFARRFPLFPLRSVSLLPHMMLEMYVYEDRYRQMIEHVLDTRGQIAMGVYADDAWDPALIVEPPMREAVCVGQIEEHQEDEDGNYRVLLHGVCRARIVEEFEPEGDRLYREATLQPLEPRPVPDERLSRHNECVTSMITTEPINELLAAKRIGHQISSVPIPAGVLFELVTLTLLGDRNVQYRLLEEASAERRAEIIETELIRTQGTLRSAQRQASTLDIGNSEYILN